MRWCVILFLCFCSVLVARCLAMSPTALGFIPKMFISKMEPHAWLFAIVDPLQGMLRVAHVHRPTEMFGWRMRLCPRNTGVVLVLIYAYKNDQLNYTWKADRKESQQARSLASLLLEERFMVMYRHVLGVHRLQTADTKTSSHDRLLCGT